VATSNPIDLAAEIVTSFVSNNSLPRGELPALIEVVHAAVSRLTERGDVAPAVIDAPAPAVSIRKSVTPDYLICLEDGKRFKSMRRHLAMLGMTPEQYRAKWNLPSTYPMVAPNYTAQRSALAKNSGFGLRGTPVAAVPASAAASEAVVGAMEVIAPKMVSVETIEVAAPEQESVIKSKRKRKEVAPEPAGVAKLKAKDKSKVVAAPPGAKVKRKPGRPGKATA